MPFFETEEVPKQYTYFIHVHLNLKFAYFNWYCTRSFFCDYKYICGRVVINVLFNILCFARNKYAVSSSNIKLVFKKLNQSLILILVNLYFVSWKIVIILMHVLQNSCPHFLLKSTAGQMSGNKQKKWHLSEFIFKVGRFRYQTTGNFMELYEGRNQGCDWKPGHIF